MGLREAVILVLAGILLVGLVIFFYKLQSALLSDPDDGSKANFQRLHKEVKKLLESSDLEDTEKTFSYFIGEDHVIVGFDTNWNNAEGQEEYADNVLFAYQVYLRDDLYKPFDCGVSACLCLYRTDSLPDEPDESSKGLVECRRSGFVGKNIVFYGGDKGDFGQEQICGGWGEFFSCTTIHDSFSSHNELTLEDARESRTRNIRITKASTGGGAYTISILNQ